MHQWTPAVAFLCIHAMLENGLVTDIHQAHLTNNWKLFIMFCFLAHLGILIAFFFSDSLQKNVYLFFWNKVLS